MIPELVVAARAPTSQSLCPLGRPALPREPSRGSLQDIPRLAQPLDLPPSGPAAPCGRRSHPSGVIFRGSEGRHGDRAGSTLILYEDRPLEPTLAALKTLRRIVEETAESRVVGRTP